MHKLTPREGDVVALLRVRHTNAEIASQLGISVRTVEHHVAQIMAKLGVINRRQVSAAVAAAAAERSLCKSPTPSPVSASERIRFEARRRFNKTPECR